MPLWQSKLYTETSRCAVAKVDSKTEAQAVEEEIYRVVKNVTKGALGRCRIQNVFYNTCRSQNLSPKI